MTKYILLTIVLMFSTSSAFATETCENRCDLQASAMCGDQAEAFVSACYSSCDATPVAAKTGGKIIPGAIDGKTSRSVGGKIIPGNNDGKTSRSVGGKIVPGAIDGKL